MTTRTMKESRSLFRRLMLGLLLFASAAVAARAADDFKIVALRPAWSNDLIQVGKNWRKDLPKRIFTSLNVNADTLASSIFVKAYFYDKDDKLVATYKKPNEVWTSTGKGVEAVGLPPTLLRTKITDVYFAIPEDLQAKKWTTVLIVFGNSTSVAVNALPATALPRLDFPEKSLVKPKAEESHLPGFGDSNKPASSPGVGSPHP